MKFSYALLKKLQPRLPAANALAARLNSYSFEVEEVKGDLLDVKLPANIYSYASAHMGLAREASAIFNLPFSAKLGRKAAVPKGKGRIALRVEDKDCFRYAARYFELPRFKETPKEIRNILETCGINPINYVVDITNYVMLETGQPLHAFDAEKIGLAPRGKARQIIVRRARKGERLTTLDKKEVDLDKEVLVVADSSKPLSLAGIKGGMDSGVTAQTKAIILEAGSWEPMNIYKTSRKIGIATDASLRFMHDLSPELVQRGIDRATDLLRQAGAKLIDSAEYYPRRAGDGIIDFDPKRYEALVGAPVLLSDATRYFRQLGFEIMPSSKRANPMLRVRVPAWRNDIDAFEDLAEEVARLSGYNELRKQAPQVALRAVTEAEVYSLKDRIRTLLPRLGLDEIYTSSFLGEAELRDPHAVLLAQAEEAAVEVANPLSDDKKYLRPSLAPLLLKSVAENARYYDAIRIFEVGKIFRKKNGRVSERLMLGIALGARKNPKIILELKEIVKEFLGEEGISDIVLKEENHGLQVFCGALLCAEIKLYPLEREWVAAVGEIDLESLQGTEPRSGIRIFAALPKYPATYRDISILVGSDSRVGSILETAAASSPEVERVDLIDEYADPKLGGKRSYTLRIVLRAKDRTLTDSEAQEHLNQIIAAIVSKHNAEIR